MAKFLIIWADGIGTAQAGWRLAKTPQPNNINDLVTVGAGPDPEVDGWTPTE